MPLFVKGEQGSNLTQGSYIPSGILIHPAVWPQQTSAENLEADCCAPFGEGVGSPSNTMSPGPRPTSLPSGILIHPTIWPQYTNVTDRTGQTDNGLIAQSKPFYKRLPKIVQHLTKLWRKGWLPQAACEPGHCPAKQWRSGLRSDGTGRNCCNSITLRLILLTKLDFVIDKYETGVLSTTCDSQTNTISDRMLIVCRCFIATYFFLDDGRTYTRSWTL